MSPGIIAMTGLREVVLNKDMEKLMSLMSYRMTLGLVWFCSGTCPGRRGVNCCSIVCSGWTAVTATGSWVFIVPLYRDL
jgi:hypothetical protein